MPLSSTDTDTAPVWTFRLGREKNVAARTPVIGGGSVYAVFYYDKKGFTESLLVAFDIETGVEQWRAVVDHVLNDPVLGPNGHIYVSSFSGSVLAYDAAGQNLWESPSVGRNIGVACAAGKDRVVFGEIHGGGRRTWCLDAATGSPLWEFDNGGHAKPLSATDDLVIHCTTAGTPSGGYDHVLHALNILDGSVQWSAKIGPWAFRSQIGGDRVFVGTREALLVHDLGSGREVAKLAFPASIEISGFRVADKSVFIADEGGAIRCLELIRKRALLWTREEVGERWSRRLAHKPVRDPLVLDGQIAVLDETGCIHFAAIGDGRPTGTLAMKTEGGTVGGLAADQGYLAATLGRSIAVFKRPGIDA